MRQSSVAKTQMMARVGGLSRAGSLREDRQVRGRSLEPRPDQSLEVPGLVGSRLHDAGQRLVGLRLAPRSPAGSAGALAAAGDSTRGVSAPAYEVISAVSEVLS